MVAGLGLFVWSLYRKIMARGAQIFPAGAKLPDVLKSLWLQQAFVEFVIANQGRSDAALQKEFGQFADACAPADEAWPTQRPGIIRVPPGTIAWPPPPGAANRPTPRTQPEGAVA